MTETGKQIAPMDEFLNRVKSKLRDDIGSMLPDAAVQQMVERVITEEFFQKRRKPAPGRGTYSTDTVEVNSPFQEMIIEACRATIEKHAMLVAERHAAEIETQIKQSVESGLITLAMRSLDKVFAEALEGHGWNIQQVIENSLRSRGLVR